MDRYNILNKKGFLTDEDRKEPLERGGEWLSFKTCLDLSKPIEVTAYGITTKVPIQRYSNDVASFIVFWKHFVMKDLNGFSGFHNVEWKLIGFEVIN